MTAPGRVEAPSTSGVSLPEKAREWLGYLGHHRRRAESDVRLYLGDVAEYGELLEQYAGRPLAGAEVLEIGFGTRASRMAAMSAAGATVTGVDMEVPLLSLRLSTLREIGRRNGSERLLKSLARHLLFDRRARRLLEDALEGAYGSRELRYGRLEVRDAASLELAPGSLDLVVSEDVFEHMTVPSLESTLNHIHGWLKPGGIALIRPNAFPGISGGHLAEWNVESVLEEPGAPRRSAPWEHLRARRWAPNTSLNELSLADYGEKFAAAGFEILEERVRHPGLGASLMTPELREELSEWSEEELFSNQVLFALRPR